METQTGEQSLVVRAGAWLADNVTQAVIGGESRFAIGARSLWEWLDEPDANFRKWWSGAKKRQKLIEARTSFAVPNLVQQRSAAAGATRRITS